MATNDLTPNFENTFSFNYSPIKVASDDVYRPESPPDANLGEWMVCSRSSSPVSITRAGYDDEVERLRAELKTHADNLGLALVKQIEAKAAEAATDLQEVQQKACNILDKEMKRAEETGCVARLESLREKRERIDGQSRECCLQIQEQLRVCKKLIIDWETYARDVHHKCRTGTQPILDKEPGESSEDAKTRLVQVRLIEMEALIGSLFLFLHDLHKLRFPWIDIGENLVGWGTAKVSYSDQRLFDPDKHVMHSGSNWEEDPQQPEASAGQRRDLVCHIPPKRVKSLCNPIEFDTSQLQKQLGKSIVVDVGLVKTQDVRVSTAEDHLQFEPSAVSTRDDSNSPVHPEIESSQFIVVGTKTHIYVLDSDDAGMRMKPAFELGEGQELKCMVSYHNTIYTVSKKKDVPQIGIYACNMLRDCTLKIFLRKTVSVDLHPPAQEKSLFSCAVTRDNLYVYIEDFSPRRGVLLTYTRQGKLVEISHHIGLSSERHHPGMFIGEAYLCGTIQHCGCLLFVSYVCWDDNALSEYHIYDPRKELPGRESSSRPKTARWTRVRAPPKTSNS